MLRKTTLKKINNWINEGFERRKAEATKDCCDYFLKAWEVLLKNAPKKYKDFILLVEKYNPEEEDYDWGSWIWEVGEELGLASKQHPECMEHRIEFIESFQKRFPKTTDMELMEYLQRTLIKTNFLLGKEEAGKKAVADFYKKIDYSVWGYIEWGDSIIKREKKPTKTVYKKALTIYEKALNLKDDEEFLDILKGRIKQVQRFIVSF